MTPLFPVNVNTAPRFGINRPSQSAATSVSFSGKRRDPYPGYSLLEEKPPRWRTALPYVTLGLLGMTDIAMFRLEQAAGVIFTLGTAAGVGAAIAFNTLVKRWLDDPELD